MDHGVGKALREARRRRRIDLAQVEESTKIRSRLLLAIENEEWDALPGETYARGFIRTYADYLGLDGERLAEQHRRDVGASRPGERLPGVGQAQAPPTRRPSPRPRLGQRALALLVSVALVAVLIVAFSSGGDGPAGTAEPERERGGAGKAANAPPPVTRKPGLSLRLTATAEIWVCLLDAKGEPLVDGQILASGAEAGPFRSGSFTVSLGNGEVAMTVNGQQASIPETPSPIGYAIGAGGGLRELPEGERPTCT